MNSKAQSLMSYQELGSGYPLVCLHGWPLDSRSNIADLEPLFQNRKDWLRLYPDFPGMGKTPGQDSLLTHDAILDRLIEWIETMIPGKRFSVYGMSFGGYMARGLVKKLGDRIDGMFLAVPEMEKDAAKLDLPKHQVVRESLEMKENIKPGEEWILEMAATQSLEMLEYMRKNIIPATQAADHEFLKKVDGGFSFDPDKLDKPFPGPVLILAGRFDRWCGYRESYKILDNFPRATYAVLDGAGHGLPSEKKELFRAMASEWLDRVEEYVR